MKRTFISALAAMMLCIPVVAETLPESEAPAAEKKEKAKKEVKYNEDGEIIKGSNQENAAYPSGICAERTALFYASSSRPDTAIKALAIAAGQNGKLCETPATPCGACRQVMAQYQTKGGRPMAVILVGADKIWKFEKVDDLLPLVFDSI